MHAKECEIGERNMKEKYFIHLLDTPVGKYIYDVNTNSIIEIGEGTFEYLKCGKKNTNQVDRDIQKMIKQGYLKTTRVEKAKNPSIDYIEDFLNNRVAYLVLQVTQGCNLRCKYCVYSGGYDTRTHILVALKQINIGRLIIHRHLTYKEKELLETQLEVFPEKINEKIIGNLDEEEILFDINIPIVLVTGISEYTNKFDVQIDLYSRFKKEGYSVGWIGSRKEAVLCGGESIPEWLYGTQLSFKDKIVYFNHYVKEYIEKNKNEVLIIGIPGEVCINDNYFIGHAGELATIISQAVNASATIVCMMFDENIEKKTKIWGNYIEGKLGVQIKCFAITNRLYDYNESDVVRKIKYTTLNNQTIQKMAKIFDGVYMISLDEEKDRLCSDIYHYTYFFFGV